MFSRASALENISVVFFARKRERYFLRDVFSCASASEKF